MKRRTTYSIHERIMLLLGHERGKGKRGGPGRAISLCVLFTLKHDNPDRYKRVMELAQKDNDINLLGLILHVEMATAANKPIIFG